MTLSDRHREISFSKRETVAAIALSDDGKLLAVHFGKSVDPPELLIFDVQTAKRLTSISGTAPTGDVLAFLPDGKRIAAGKGAKTLEQIGIWDIERKELVQTVETPEAAKGSCSHIAFSPDAR